jgi:HSF-type DNA-binding
LKVLSQTEYTEIITWLPDGKSFTIIRPKAFVAEILPDIFKSAKYSSFTRKLHRWGFQRHLRGEHAGAFYHKHFIRGRLDLVERMTCHKDDGTTMDMKQKFIPRTAVTSGESASVRDVVARDAPNTTLTVQQTQFQLQQQLLQLQQMQEQLQSLQQLQQQNFMRHQHDQQAEHFRGPVQQQQALQLPSRQESKDGNSFDRLNAAIDLEVSRRLSGRVQATASDRFVAPSGMPSFYNNDRLQLSRHSLAMNLGMPNQTSQFNVDSSFPPGSFSGMQNLIGEGFNSKLPYNMANQPTF